MIQAKRLHYTSRQRGAGNVRDHVRGSIRAVCVRALPLETYLNAARYSLFHEQPFESVPLTFVAARDVVFLFVCVEVGDTSHRDELSWTRVVLQQRSCRGEGRANSNFPLPGAKKAENVWHCRNRTAGGVDFIRDTASLCCCRLR